jgi:hypothetical protein
MSIIADQEDNYMCTNRWLLYLSVWRPLNKVNRDMPLAICDARTLKEDDFIAVDRIGRAFIAEIAYVKESKTQEWYWLSDQRNDEALVFRCWDSDPPNGKMDGK